MLLNRFNKWLWTFIIRNIKRDLLAEREIENVKVKYNVGWFYWQTYICRIFITCPPSPTPIRIVYLKRTIKERRKWMQCVTGGPGKNINIHHICQFTLSPSCSLTAVTVYNKCKLLSSHTCVSASSISLHESTTQVLYRSVESTILELFSVFWTGFGGVGEGTWCHNLFPSTVL